MATVLVYVEHKDGKVKKVTHELLTEANRAGAEAIAFLAGNGVDGLVKDVAAMGAKKVMMANSDATKFYNNEVYSELMLQAIKQVNPSIILFGATALGKDLAPKIAAKLGAAMASDCTKLSIEGDKLKATRPIYSGKALADVQFTGAGPQIATVRPNALGVGALNSGANAEVINLTGAASSKSSTKDVVKSESTKLDVTEANVVISGGRSLKSADGFKILEDLSSVVPNSAVGASRAAVDAGYRPHRDQVGQTGKVVSPSVYIACGISGAIQHLAGMRTSKIIVAINKDPEAPIFQLADYGIVGDLFEVVPKLTEEMKKLH